MKLEFNENSLSEQRTLFASERTFSAWIRTALAAMAGGLGILRLIIFKTEMHRIIGHLLGIILILWGILIILLASIDYKKTQDSLPLAKSFKTSQMGIFIIILPLLIISGLLIWLILPI